jgi:hypothetical protein
VSPGVSDIDALFTVTGAQFTSSTLPEAPPPAWSSGTTYALGATASIAAGVANALDVYESIQAPGNTNRAPASSPAWWKLLGRTYPVYAAGTYAAGDRVIDPVAHLEYQSLVSGNAATLADATKWQLLGPTNKWRAVDVLRNTKASGPSGTTFVFTPGQRIDAVGLAGLLADSFTLTLKVAGVTKWTHTERLTTRNTLTWSDYFFGAFGYRGETGVFDIPRYSGCQLTLTFTRANGDIEVGGIWINEAVYLGELEAEPNVGRRNFSTVDRKAGGELTLIRRQNKKTNTWTLFCPKDRLSKVSPLPDDLDAVPAMWFGLEDVTDEYFGLVAIVAIHTRFDITPGQADARIDLGLEET